jgi:hypothetical protein
MNRLSINKTLANIVSGLGIPFTRWSRALGQSYKNFKKKKFLAISPKRNKKRYWFETESIERTCPQYPLHMEKLSVL